MSKLTIGLPVYNAEGFLKDCIQSILNQTYGDFKLLIVNDGSTDGSLSIIEKFKDSRIQLINDGQNLGLIARLNQISQMCTTELLARMDADDIMHVDRLKIQVGILMQNPRIDVLGSNVYSIDDDNNIRGVRFAFNSNSTESKIHKVGGFVHPSIMGKTVWFKANPYNKKATRVEDKELWMRTRKNAHFYCVDQPLLYYREVEGEYHKKHKKAPISFFKVSKEYFYKRSFKESLLFFTRGMTVVGKLLSYRMLLFVKKENILFNRRVVSIDEKQCIIGKNNFKKSISE